MEGDGNNPIRLAMNKQELLEFSISNFTKFGSKNTTMDELANKMGMSKKTLYQHFQNKEELVTESLSFLLDKIKLEVQEKVCLDHPAPLEGIIMVYTIAFKYLELFSPSFVFGNQKYYPAAHRVYEQFRSFMVYGIVFDLLKKAKDLGQIRKQVDLELVCEMYLLRVDYLLFAKTNLLEKYDKSTLTNHLITNNLRGILTPEYAMNSHWGK